MDFGLGCMCRAGHSQVKKPPDGILTKVVSTAGSDLQISLAACLMQLTYTPKASTFLQEVTAVLRSTHGACSLKAPQAACVMLV